ncbi:MAG: hypothetical protein AAF497_23650 [Planctomycetota bacterium]
MQTSPDDFIFLNDHISTEINGRDSLHVRTYAMAYNDDPLPFGDFVFTSLFHEFSSVPEPSSVWILLVSVALSWRWLSDFRRID